MISAATHFEFLDFKSSSLLLFFKVAKQELLKFQLYFLVQTAKITFSRSLNLKSNDFAFFFFLLLVDEKQISVQLYFFGIVFFDICANFEN